MSGYRLLKHRQYELLAERLPDSIRRKAMWAQVLLGTRGRTPNVKTTTGYNARWRRTPVQGYHYYLWWIPLSESELAGRAASSQAAPTILVHSIRHHDETDNPIDLASLDEFEEVPLISLDPRFDEQHAVGRQFQVAPIVPATVRGLPGSGKTVALFYLVRDLVLERGLEQLLYVTYTSRLKRAAREFLGAQAPELAQRVHIRTLAELEKELTGLPALSDPLSDLADFRRYLELQPSASLGGWRRYPATLYTEIRAHILGRTFPAGYPLPTQRLAETVFADGQFDVGAYAAARGLTREEANAAARLAERLRGDRFFLDQTAASQALGLLLGSPSGALKLPAWLRTLDGLVVDEVQDLTLLQVAFLAELARRQARQRRLAVVVAGDESQIVQPSGFDWGSTKDLLREVLGANPQEFEFRHQRRSPRNLAYVIDNAWNFYAQLPKTLRPSANRQSFLDDAEMELAVSTHRPDLSDEHGRLLICPLPETLQQQNAESTRQWRAFVAELAELPGRALIDLCALLPNLANGRERAAEEVLFNVREIKGLERNTVILLGLNQLYQQVMRLTASSSDVPPLLEARRLIDEMRVALSRSTDKLVLLEEPDAPVLDALAIDNVAGHYTVSWNALRDLLRTEQMSEIEVVEGYLDEVDDLIERKRWEPARSRNRRAHEFAVQMEDRALQREAQSQYIQIFVQEAASDLLQDRLADAIRLNQQARALAADLGDPAAIDEADEQRETLRDAVSARLASMLTDRPEQDLGLESFYLRLEALHPLVAGVADDRLQQTLDEARVSYGWQLGLQRLAAWPDSTVPDSTGPDVTVPALFAELAGLLQRQPDPTGASVATLVAERYAALPLGQPLTAAQVPILLHAVDTALSLRGARRWEQDLCRLAEVWLEEAFAQLDSHVSLYDGWALCAERYNAEVGYLALDERLWDLEKRVELAYGVDWMTASAAPAILRFAALIAAYNGQPHEASIAWEKLGEFDRAIAQARQAGELERAYALLRQTGQPIPDALSTAVKLKRQAEQLLVKQQQLSDGERSALAGQLRSLLAALEIEAGESSQTEL
jgi:hypothetical protein